jgi:hypothetical protein
MGVREFVLEAVNFGVGGSGSGLGSVSDYFVT